MRLFPRLSGKGILRKIGLGVMADNWPHRLPFPFEQTVPKHVYRRHKGWITYPGYIKEARTTIECYDGGDFVDVGSSAGVYVLLLSPKADNAKYLILEPDPESIKELSKTLSTAINNNPKFIPYLLPVAAGSENRIGVEFHTNQRRFYSDVVKVDDMVRQFKLKPTFVKIDVDGPEMHVLLGMKEVIKDYRPYVLLELHPPFWKDNETEDMIFSLLPDYAFTLIWQSTWEEFPGAKCSRYLCRPTK